MSAKALILVVALSHYYFCNALQTRTSPQFQSAIYFPNWDIYARDYQPQSLPATSITHVLYAFANVNSDTGEVYLSDTYADLEKHYPTDSWDSGSTSDVYGCIKQLYLLKKKNRNLKVLLSIGGWTYSSNFAAPLATANGRSTFVTSAIQLLKNLGLDGFDIDWEYPSNETQAQNFVQLLQAMRQALDGYAASFPSSPRFLLTVAAPTGPDHYQQLDVKGMDQFLDFWNLMAYDYAGSWSTSSGHQANVYPSKSTPNSTLFSTDAAVQYYLGQSVAGSKILLGIPLYGRAFEETAGIGQKFSGVGSGSWENGVWDVKALPQAGARAFYDRDVIASWSWDATAQKIISYDTAQVVRAKIQYLQGRGLGGTMWWEASGDYSSTSSSLVQIAAQALGALAQESNWLDYPDSNYSNLKNGMPDE